MLILSNCRVITNRRVAEWERSWRIPGSQESQVVSAIESTGRDSLSDSKIPESSAFDLSEMDIDDYELEPDLPSILDDGMEDVSMHGSSSDEFETMYSELFEESSRIMAAMSVAEDDGFDELFSDFELAGLAH